MTMVETLYRSLERLCYKPPYVLPLKGVLTMAHMRAAVGMPSYQGDPALRRRGAAREDRAGPEARLLVFPKTRWCGHQARFGALQGYPMLCYPIQTYPTLPYLILSFPILSYLTQPYHTLPYPILSYPILSCPVCLSVHFLCIYPPNYLSDCLFIYLSIYLWYPIQAHLTYLVHFNLSCRKQSLSKTNLA